ncbi:PAS domain S-box-containing protein [Flavobacterium swingsii]|jgi:PAS domain S-box-containing protein|uniref:PAS domain S-box-containing protein n=1 Tax=Flavobacterium swingsii TaxID=498292 RepID=A0A1I0VED6_9FLAO|nr:PAS domain-containing protein [Flavobacterium swingsii]SFA73956.1 PAS domain S-box-containing protein [Flavobacterium swingsii]
MLEEYEKAFAKYRKGLKTIPLPIICWDFHSIKNLELLSFDVIQKNWNGKISFLKIVNNEKKDIIVTDKNFKIIFATKSIVAMTGYQAEEIMGKSPKIFQGILTSETTKTNIRQAITNKLPFKEVIVNYKKDGSTYLCEIEAIPKFDKKGEFLNYIAFERIAS